MEASAQQSYSVRVENRRQRFTLLGCDPNSCCGLTGHNAHCTKPSLLVCDSHMSQLLLLDLQRLRLLQAVLQQRRANFPAVRWELHSWIKQGVSCYPGGSKALRAHYDGLGLRSIKNLQSTLDLLLSNPEWLPFAGNPNFHLVCCCRLRRCHLMYMRAISSSNTHSICPRVRMLLKPYPQPGNKRSSIAALYCWHT